MRKMSDENGRLLVWRSDNGRPDMLDNVTVG